MAFSLGVYLGKMIGCEVMVIYLQDSLLALSSQTVKLCYLFRFFYIQNGFLTKYNYICIKLKN